MNKNFLIICFVFFELSWSTILELKEKVEVSEAILHFGDLLNEQDKKRFEPFLDIELARIGNPGTERSFNSSSLCRLGVYPILRKAKWELPECEGTVQVRRSGQEISLASVEEEVRTYLRTNIPAKDSTSWEWSSEWAPLQTPIGKHEVRYEWPQGDKLRGPVRFVLKVFEDENLVLQRRLTILVKHFAKAPYLKEQLQRDQAIDLKAIEWKWTDLTRDLRPSPDSLLLVHSQARRTLSKDRRIRWSDLEKKQLVKRGEQVVVRSKKLGPALSVLGIAQEDGGYDDQIAVTNSISGKKILGRVDEGGTVWIE